MTFPAETELTLLTIALPSLNTSAPAQGNFAVIGMTDMLRNFAWIAIAGMALNMAGVGSVNAEDQQSWMSWRGPNRDSYLPSANWPTTLEGNFNKKWSFAAGDSYSGPIMTAESVFTTETKSGNETLYAIDRKTGAQQWEYTWKGSMTVPFFAMRNGSWIRSTPATDGKLVFVGGIRDLLLAIDCKTGELKWKVDFAENSGKVPDFGMVCSPLVDGDHLYVQAGKGLHKLEAATGKIVWSSLADNGDMMSSGAFSSPVIQTLNGTRQLVVQTRTFLAGVNLDTGSPLWKYEVTAFRGMNILTPTIWDNGIFTSSYGGRSLLLNIGAGSDGTDVRWENKLEGYMSSPVIIDNFIYLHLRNKRFACLDLSTGKECWITKPYGEYWSMITNGKEILALDQTGKLRLIAHNPEKFDLISEVRVSEDESWAHLAIEGDQVFIRSQKELMMFEWK